MIPELRRGINLGKLEAGGVGCAEDDEGKEGAARTAVEDPDEFSVAS